MVGLILLIACLNLTNLQRTRMLRRSHEFAIRSALGSSRQRLLQQLVAEMILLGACGGLLSLGIAHVLGSTLVRLASDRPIHVNLRFGLDLYVFCSISLLIALVLFQMLPARKLLLAEALPSVGLTSARGSIGAGANDGGDTMLGAQIALCVLLLSLAAMFVRTLRNLNGLNAGVDRQHVLTVRFDFYNSNFGDAALAALYPEMLNRLRSLPGVRFAVQDTCPPPNCLWNTPVHAAGISGETESHQDDVGPGYFRAMGIPLLRGREFDNEDRPTTADVAIVNRTLATRLFGPNENPVGLRVARRTSEFGVRMALGASRGDVFAMVLGQALRVSAIGGLSGGVLAVVFSHSLRNLLFDVRDHGLVSWLLAAFVPARRAMKVDPMVALRYE